MADVDPDAAAKIVTSFLAGQPLLTWPPEILNRMGTDTEPNLLEITTVFGRLVEAHQLAPEELKSPLMVLINPLHQIVLQYKAAADEAGRRGKTTLNVSINLKTDPAAYRQAVLEVFQWLNANGYRLDTDSDVPDPDRF